MTTAETRLPSGRRRDRSVRVGVVGLGYVGLPLAHAFASSGAEVWGVDVDESRVRALRRGRSYIADLSDSAVSEVVKKGLLHLESDFRCLRRVDAIIVCVPTPLRKSKDPDISYIVQATERLAPVQRRGQLVVLESTTYPGTTREVVLPRLSRRGAWRVGRDFFLAFSPERVDPGNARFGIRNTPKVVAGITPACAERATTLYRRVVDRVVPVSSPESAEMVKLLENTFRAVNIGLVNEVALMCRRLGLDAWEVIEAAATKPFGFMPFFPGPGIGGHCIPLDPQYLSWKLKTLDFHSKFIDLAEEINARMPDVVIDRVAALLNEAGKPVRGSRVLVLGVAYKANVGDSRESPALHIIQGLRERGARVAYHDPHVPTVRGKGEDLRSVPLTDERLRGSDAVVIVTAHAAFDPARIVRNAPAVFDCRNATRGLTAPTLRRL